jgi:hypothetical protein
MKTAEAMAIRATKANRNILAIMSSPCGQGFRQLGDIRRNPPHRFHREKRRKSIAGCFVKRSAELFGKGARCRQIEKAPAVINLPVSECSTSKSQRDVVPLVKIDNLTVQFDIQSIRVDGHLDNKGVFRLVGGRLTGASK